VLKARVTFWGKTVLGLTLAGTALGTMPSFVSTSVQPSQVASSGPTSSAQPPGSGQTVLDSATVIPGWAAELAHWVAAIVLGLATFLTGQLLGDSERQAWIKARALAEALKSESLKYVAGAPPYDIPGADQALRQKVVELQQLMGGVLAETISPDERSKGLPETAWTLDAYADNRVREQIDKYYQPAIARHRRAVNLARTLALVFGALTVILTASRGSADARLAELHIGPTFLAGLLGSMTTAAALIAAWFQSGHHQQLAQNYQAAASKLRLLLTQPRTKQFVIDAEAIMQAEHAAWLAEWQVQTSTAQPPSPASQGAPSATAPAS
jgi:hypothetical protein